MHHMPGKGFTFRHTAAVARRNNARRSQQLQAQQQQQQHQAPQQNDAEEEEHEPEPVAEDALVQAMVQGLHEVLDTPENPLWKMQVSLRSDTWYQVWMRHNKSWFLKDSRVLELATSM